MSQIYNYKFIVIGNPGVGKTSLIKNFVEGSFLSEYKSTIGTNLYTKTLEFKRDKSEDNKENEITIIEAWSNWILEQINICGWAHSFEDEARENIIKYGYAKHIFRILIPPTDASSEMKSAYFAWVEKAFLDSIKKEDPNLYQQVADLYKVRIVDTTLKGDEQEETT